MNLRWIIFAGFALLLSSGYAQESEIRKLNELLQAHGLDHRKNNTDGRWWQDTYILSSVRNDAGSAELVVNTAFRDGDIWRVIYRFSWVDFDISRSEIEKLAPGSTGNNGWVSRDVRYQVTLYTENRQKLIRRTGRNGKVEFRDHIRIMFTDKYAADRFVEGFNGIVKTQ